MTPPEWVEGRGGGDVEGQGPGATELKVQDPSTCALRRPHPPLPLLLLSVLAAAPFIAVVPPWLPRRAVACYLERNVQASDGVVYMQGREQQWDRRVVRTCDRCRLSHISNNRPSRRIAEGGMRYRYASSWQDYDLQCTGEGNAIMAVF